MTSKLVSLGNEQLAFHHVDAGHLFSDRVFHLNSRVHFDEVKLLTVRIDQKLHRPCVGVLHVVADRNRCLTKIGPNFLGQVGGRRNFDHLLMASLDRTIPFMQVDEVGVFITENLHFDVAGSLHESFEEHIAATESR